MKLLTVCLMITLMLAGAAAAGERGELVLAWDDEESPRAIYPVPIDGRKIAVMFEAPEGFDWLRGILCYLGNDDQSGPTDPFTLTVWAPEDTGSGFMPGAVVYEYASSGYPEECWVQFNSPEYVCLNDTGTFPDRVFFVGIQWLTMGGVALGVDWDPIVSGKTWQKFITTGWGLYPEPGNCACVRAVVTDESDTVVELKSWGLVKSSYRTP